MSLSISIGRKLLYLGLLARVTLTQDNPCITFGVDFQDGGSYFQNSLSTSPFTFVQEFEGCQNDTSQNLLVDPNGNEYQCTDTPLLPSDTPELSTCPIDEDQLFSGSWSIIIISNNGDAQPIAYERDFVLTVSPQSTTTFTPTVTATVTSTPIVNSTVVVTDTDSITLPQSTITEPSTTLTPTRTITPHRVTVRETKTLFTVTKVRPTIIISKSTSTVTATCSIPKHRHTPDPTCKIHPTLIHAAALEPSSAKFRIKDRSIENKAEFLEARRDRLVHMAKRAPDQPTITVTDTNTADYITVNATVTASTSTLTVTSTSEVTDTITPSPIIVLSGRSTAPVVTVTAPTPTRTIIKDVIATSTIVRTWSTTIVIKSTTTPAASASACKKSGGIMI